VRRIVIVGLVLATAAVAYAAAGERLTLEGIRGWFGSNHSLPAMKNAELPFRYPADLWRAGVEGQVVLKIHITETGVVDSVEVADPSGDERLDSIAVEGARRLTYYPARENDEPVAVWARLPVRFQRGTVSATPEGR
jgi:TonB family protein